MSDQGPCEYCSRPGDRIDGDGDGLDRPLYVCAPCMKLLRDPKVGLQLVRGNVTLALRGTGRGRDVRRRIDRFMETLAGWRPKN